jgi:glycosyltransferase involved in cell wall biosynthesis
VIICYLCHADNYHIKKWAQALADEGHELHLLTFRPFNFSHHNIHIYPLKPIFSSIFYSDFLAIVPRVRNIIQRIQPDVTLASFANTYGLTATLADIQPRIIQTWSRDIAAPDSVNTRERWMALTIGKYVLNQADAITTDSHNFADILRTRWPDLSEKILPTPWGIKIANYTISSEVKRQIREQLNIPSDAIVLTSIRGVYWYYNPHLLLSALLQLQELWDSDAPPLYLNILTLDHPRPQHVQNLLDEIELLDNVRVVDSYLDFTHLKQIWAVTDFFISIPKFDGISEALQEGRMAGAIPILNDLPANREVAQEGEHAFYVRTNSVEALATDIKAILETPRQDLVAIQSANKEWIRQNANVDQTISDLTQLMEQLSVNS